MQETELRKDMLEFLDDIEDAIISEDYDLARKDIKEYRQYLKETTKIEAVVIEKNDF